MKIVKILIPLRGLSTKETKVTVETVGFTGEGCLAATAAMEAALGTVADSQLTDEYHRVDPQIEYLSSGGQ